MHTELSRRCTHPYVLPFTAFLFCSYSWVIATFTCTRRSFAFCCYFPPMQCGLVLLTEGVSWEQILKVRIGGESSSQVLHQILAPFDVLVYLGCCNKIPEWVAYKQFFFFFFTSEGWKPKMRVPYSGSQSSCYVLTKQKELCGVSLYEPALISFISTPLSWLKHFQIPHLLTPSH